MALPITRCVFAAVLLLAACDTVSEPDTTAPGGTSPPGTSTPPPPTAPSLVPVRIEMYSAPRTAPIFAGTVWSVGVAAYDSAGRPASSAGATITVSDPARARYWVSTYSENSGPPLTHVTLRFEQAGELRVRVRLGTLTDSLDLTAVPDPPLTAALHVDEFAVYEYRVSCTWDCPYLAYAPVLRVSEPSGSDSPTLHGFDFLVGGERAGTCEENVLFRPGETRPFTGVDPYLWSNGVIVVRLDGVPIPADSATARIIVRQSDGTYGLVEARGPVRRVSSVDAVPGPRTSPWGC